MFLVDGMRPRYSAEDLQQVRGSYFDRMRKYFILAADRLGYEVVDLQGHFARHYAREQLPFETELDYHWNAIGHEVAADAVRDTEAYRHFLSLPTSP